MIAQTIDEARRGRRRPFQNWDRQRIRDVPRSCACPWLWSSRTFRWVRLSTDLGCPWHSRAPWIDVREL